MRHVLLGTLLLTGAAVPQAAPKDPARFLNIHEWHGEATVVLQGAKDGKSVDRRFSTKFRIEMPVGFRATLEGMAKVRKEFGGAIPPQMDDMYKKSIAEVPWTGAFGKQEETLEVIVKDERQNETLTAAPPPVTRVAKAFLRMNLPAGTYDVRVDTGGPVEMTSTVKGKPPKKFNQSAVRGLAEAKKQPLPSDKDVLTGRIQLEVGSGVVGLFLPDADLQCWFEWTLSPDPLPPLELDVDIANFATWLPEGKEDGFGVGNTLDVQAELRAKGGGTLKEKCIRIAFHLIDYSREPGSAMNAPAAGGEDPDLRFDAALNPTLEISPERHRALAKNPGLRASARISCLDFGAWGELTVTAWTDIGRFVEGTSALQPGETRIRVPMRDKSSKIADAWKKGPAAGKADTADEDTQPAGPKTAGDGLTLYEEYRGFFVGGKHVRTDPDMRDLFVLTRTNHAKVLAGVSMFETASGLKVHVDQNETLLKDRRINYNSKTGFGGVQHGVVIMGFTPALSKITYARHVGGSSTAGTPKDFQHIEIAADMVGLPAKTAKWTTAKGPEPLVAGVAHELCHTVNIAHHGDDWDFVATWKVRSAGGGTYAVTEVAGGKEKPVTVIREDGKPYPWTKEQDIDVNIGFWQGVDSGAWDCLMRYDNANAYVYRPDPSVRVDIHGDEVTGTSLCGDPKGTGTNDAGRGDYARFGKATKGNCAGQIRVKDWP